VALATVWHCDGVTHSTKAKNMKKIACVLVSTCALWLAANAAAQSASYPSHAIRLVVPLPPGGPTDIAGRLFAKQLSERLGQPVVIENRSGAGGTVGTEAAAQAPKDGYSLLYGNAAGLGTAPALYPKLGYDPVRSFAPISLIAKFPVLVIVHDKVPARSLQELIALAKARPGELHYASAGNGTPPHIAAAMFETAAGVKLVHVPYRGGGPAVEALVAGQVEIIFEGLASTRAYVQSGRFRPLAVAYSARLQQLPDVPTAAEAGLPGFEAVGWSGLLAPSGTSDEIVRRLNAALRQAMASPELRKEFAAQGFEPSPCSPEEFSAFIKTEMVKWTKAVKESGATID
jgi:tripartite-type tricarboxylate transporter receptor subunit TctC